jgi:hypothetical protein
VVLRVMYMEKVRRRRGTRVVVRVRRVDRVVGACGVGVWTNGVWIWALAVAERVELLVLIVEGLIVERFVHTCMVALGLRSSLCAGAVSFCLQSIAGSLRSSRPMLFGEPVHEALQSGESIAEEGLFGSVVAMSFGAVDAV